MANVNAVQDDGGHTERYGEYQNEVYAQGMMYNIKPTITQDSNKLEAQAKESMSDKSWSYVAGGAGERATMDANRLAFRQWKVCFIGQRECSFPKNRGSAPKLQEDSNQKS